mgnify:CR=1 FL=1
MSTETFTQRGPKSHDFGYSRRVAEVVDADDATPHLRDDGVERNVSLVSRVPEVRAALVRIQRELAAAGGLAISASIASGLTAILQCTPAVTLCSLGAPSTTDASTT